ncbi:MAG: hypothetical protein Q4P32_08320 [Micrococcales bacterium]|nr:hypothetical protein [Micrococcales bacterium]
MHLDIPTLPDIQRLAEWSASNSVSIFLRTDVATPGYEDNMARARAAARTAVDRLKETTDRRTWEKVQEHLESLLEDNEFWAHTGRSVAIFATPDSIVEYRLPNGLNDYVSVGDRFTFTPLLRALTFPQAAFVLALAQNGVRLIEVSPQRDAVEVALPELPDSAEQAIGLRSIGGRSAYGRIQGDEGRKVRLTQYARGIDHALRPFLNGQSLPLIVAAPEPLASIFRNLTGYGQVADHTLRGNPEQATPAELAEEAREVLDEIYAQEVEKLRETFRQRRESGRASTDLSDLARAAAFGAIGTLAIDMDAKIAGSIGDGGKLELATPGNDVLEDLARRALAGGARVLALRAADMPEDVSAAGILRYAV